MNFLDVRNTVVKLLAKYLDRPVVLSDQVQPVEEAYPFGYYNVLTPYTPTGEQGDYAQIPNDDGVTVETTRREQPYATFSFTFCSVNRWTTDDNGDEIEPYIYGEDEAQRLAERAQGFFLHVAYNELSDLGIVVVEVTNTTNRTTLVVDEAARRYGFDVRVRYSRVESRTDNTVAGVAAYQKKE